MRFKCNIAKHNLIILHSVVEKLKDFTAIGTIIIRPECLQLSVIGDSTDSPRAYLELPSDRLFNEYQVQSLKDNIIMFDINLEDLHNALTSGKSAAVCLLKLVKREGRPNLALETRSHDMANVTHDILIRLKSSTDLAFHSPPSIPPPQVALELPKSKQMHRIVDKMTKFAKNIHLTARQSGGEEGGSVCKAIYPSHRARSV
jgi:Hus1-like protein